MSFHVRFIGKYRLIDARFSLKATTFLISENANNEISFGSISTKDRKNVIAPVKDHFKNNIL